MEINVGDIVRRKKGGPDMTVEKIFDGSTDHHTAGAYYGVKIGNILCYWLRDMELCRAVFRPEDIEVVEKSSKPFL